MSKLKVLTEDQSKLMETVRDEWIAFALSGDAVLYKATAEEGIRWMYQLAKLAPPSEIVFCDSPKAAVVEARRRGATITNTHYWGLGYWSGWAAFYDFFSRIG